MIKFKCTIYFFFILTAISNAGENFRNIEIKGKLTCIISNGVPSHDIGRFPNSANPNSFKKQKLNFCFPTIPQLTEKVTWGLMTVGVSISGIPIRPYTAEYFDSNGKRGYSRNPASGWRKQAMYLPRSLGIDQHNGHVDKSGLYHYHSVSKNKVPQRSDLLIGYAPDGFKIFYNPNKATSSWRLRSGTRTAPPGGFYSGEFEQDFEYRVQSGSLDECNGKKVDGVYTYYATTSYPFFPRCFKGKVNLKFMVRD